MGELKMNSNIEPVEISEEFSPLEETFILMDLQDYSDFYEISRSDLIQFFWGMYEEYEFESDEDEQAFDDTVLNGDFDALDKQAWCVDYVLFRNIEEREEFLKEEEKN
jgi:hypothetical protein